MLLDMLLSRPLFLLQLLLLCTELLMLLLIRTARNARTVISFFIVYAIANALRRDIAIVNIIVIASA